ncbi:ATP-dependent helicase [Salinibacter ruber]|uniref:ATP-dependent helicase n=1 Tax=Salinibacter ruber TaxID=146919 RepID=UPI00216711B9|nr:ATP-dependent helicase [Salinibacter ruber]MCS4101253.1 DNA helicase-2/ATP-dependent DNA helicase PcrA [Salinibacter ruber]
MIDREQLTDEQTRIVQHGRGPALVFAVAGAGKTTSLVHRIARLVTQGGVAPGDILASSFSRATAQDLEAGLTELGLPDVNCRTLHSLGRQFLKWAEAEHHWSRRLGDEDLNPSRLGPVLAGRALTRLARERDVDDHELDIDRGELEDQVSAWKAQLCYPDLDEAALPPAAREEARQAEHDNEDFVTLYQYYEEERRREGWVTFDDMLLEGWEALLRFDDLRARAQQAYEHVLIDEFQDISRVQYQMLDVLTEPHRNYMAVGDDDQCIYEWRGANPSFILDFREEYEADEYLIRDTFRSQAPHTVLANAVIAHNDHRREKHLNLTRGFGGRTQVHAADGADAEATHVAGAIESQLDTGRTLPEMVVLVRQYAQTPSLEQVFIDRDLPYRIVGNVPFYRRRPVQVLLRHLFWGTLEATVRTAGWFDHRRNAQRYVDRFQKLMREPNRYVSTDLITRLCREAVGDETSITDLLAASMGAMHDRTAERVERFLDTADQLVDRLDEPAHRTVDWLIKALDYEDYLRRYSAFEELADRRIRTARSLIDFARGHPDVPSVLRRIKEISVDRPDRGAQADVLEIRSIHRAKGREWPVVFVPGCNDGTIPTSRDDSAMPPPDEDDSPGASGDAAPENADPDDAPAARREEERRLFYVALTRAQEQLHLSYDRTEPPSPFLAEADAEHRLALCDRVRPVFHRPADDWAAADVAWLCIGAGALRLRRYLTTWWDPTETQRRALAAHLGREEALREAADAEIVAYARDPGAEEKGAHDASSPTEEGSDASETNGSPDRETRKDADASTGASVDAATAQQLGTAFEEGREVVEDALGLGPDEADPANAPAEKPQGVTEDDAVGGTVAE